MKWFLYHIQKVLELERDIDVIRLYNRVVPHSEKEGKRNQSDPKNSPNKTAYPSEWMDCGNPIKKLFCPDKRQRERYCTDSNQLSTNTQRSIRRRKKRKRIPCLQGRVRKGNNQQGSNQNSSLKKSHRTRQKHKDSENKSNLSIKRDIIQYNLWNSLPQMECSQEWSGDP